MLPATICLAWKYTPYSTGIVVDKNMIVLAVNVGGPAYNSGVRPGDIILSVSDGGTSISSLAARESLYASETRPIVVNYKRNETQLSTTIIPTKLLDTAVKTTYLVIGNAQDNYDRLVKSLTFHPNISALFPIQSMDNNLKMVRTYSSVARKTVNEMPIYLIAPGGSGFGFTALETIGNFALIDSKDGQWSILKVNLSFRAEFAHLFGQSWENFTSSGVLERKLIECMFDNI